MRGVAARAHTQEDAHKLGEAIKSLSTRTAYLYPKVTKAWFMANLKWAEIFDKVVLHHKSGALTVNTRNDGGSHQQRRLDECPRNYRRDPQERA